MPALIIHVGVHKTGSTAIQHYLWRHAERLATLGVLYPAAGRPADQAIAFGHHEIPWSFNAHGPCSEGALARLRTELAETSAVTAIISSEEFDRLDAGAVARLAEALPFPTTVIFYYRRQADILAGIYGTDVLYDSEAREFADYAVNYDGALDFDEFARRWTAAYGAEHVIARRYDPPSFVDRNVVPDFFAAVGLADVFAASPEEEFRYNESLPWYVVLSVLHFRRTGVPETALARFVEAMSVVCRGEASGALISPDEADAIDRRFAEANAAFAAAFGVPPPQAGGDMDEQAFRAGREGVAPHLDRTMTALASFTSQRAAG